LNLDGVGNDAGLQISESIVFKFTLVDLLSQFLETKNHNNVSCQKYAMCKARRV